MSFRGLRDFSTNDPKRLRSDLQRHNQNLEQAFAEIPRESAQRWRIVRVTEALYQAKHGDFVLAGYEVNASIVLPRSISETSGRSVRIAQVGGLGGVTVVAPAQQLVNGLSSVAIGVNTGWLEFTDDGIGGFWGPAV